MYSSALCRLACSDIILRSDFGGVFLMILKNSAREMMAPDQDMSFMYLKRTGSSNTYMVHCFTDSLLQNDILRSSWNCHPMDTVDTDSKIENRLTQDINNNDIVQRTP
ncbi:hypothetical protein AVEN_151117-1 [Araneus ventricosus]|uniref:Uncharacterized protein n=1 Tax=Araneus ventricosus TaxID=182803 RepID=A0A4Y2K8Z1_ARAVE|nr:hypothetical protein AVEN_151117-1 [Araneus ventricosus]